MKRILWHRPSPGTIFGLAALVVAVGGVALATIPDSSGTIHGCYDRRGTLRVVDTEAGRTCRTSETALTWNQQGPQGPPGAGGALHVYHQDETKPYGEFATLYDIPGFLRVTAKCEDSPDQYPDEDLILVTTTVANLQSTADLHLYGSFIGYDAPPDNVIPPGTSVTGQTQAVVAQHQAVAPFDASFLAFGGNDRFAQGEGFHKLFFHGNSCSTLTQAVSNVTPG